MFTKTSFLTALALAVAVSAQYAVAAEWSSADGRSAAQVAAQPLREGVRSTMQPQNFNRNDRTISNDAWREHASVDRPDNAYVSPDFRTMSNAAVTSGVTTGAAVSPHAATTTDHLGGEMPDSIRNHMLPQNFNRNNRTVDNDTWYEKNAVTR